MVPMKITADLHIHSRFSRATSTRLSVDNLIKYAKIKGVSLLGTGDFTHPKWLRELKNKLAVGEGGIMEKGGFPFILSTEISSIYKQGDSVKRIHNLLLVPDFEAAEKVNDSLAKRGVNLSSDGRPICGLRGAEIVELVREADERNEVIPAHIWTPWFSLFGSRSGFDRIEECFGDQTKNISALETGLSSDPAMNWRVSALDRFSLVSFSDAHSFWPWRLGREATVFELKEPSYDGVIKAIRTGDGLLETIEVDPSYGKYHYDGHRRCKVCMKPEETMRNNNICPVCKRPLTVGVMNRVEELADRPEGFRPKNGKPFRSLLPLSEILSLSLGSGVSSKKVWKEYNALVKAFGSELKVLTEAGEADIMKVSSGKTAGLVIGVREGKIDIKPGYDGVYGELMEPKDHGNRQRSLQDFS